MVVFRFSVWASQGLSGAIVFGRLCLKDTKYFTQRCAAYHVIQGKAARVELWFIDYQATREEAIALAEKLVSGKTTTVDLT